METLRLNRQAIISAIPLFTIFASTSARMLFMLKIGEIGLHSSVLIGTWLGLQFVFATIEGIFSDFFSRKLILAFSIAGKAVGLSLIFTENILSAIIIDGVFGNITPVARAAYCDVHISQKRIPNIVNTFLVQSIPWIVLSLFAVSSFSFIFVLCFLFVALLLVLFLFVDFRDHTVVGVKHFRNVFQRDLIMVALAFLFLNSQWWLLTHVLEQKYLFSELVVNSFMINGISFFLGVLFLKMLVVDIEKTLVLVFFLIFSTVFLKVCFSVIYGVDMRASVDLMLQFTLLGGLGQPLIYSLFGKRVAIHEQGAAYGLLESVQYFSEILWLGFAFFLKAMGFTYLYMILVIISGVSLVLTWIGLYSKLSKTRS